MAEFTEKKYLDLEGLKVYDTKVKAYVETKAGELDAQVLADAKAYCDQKDILFEPAGALTSAKAYTDDQIATVNETVAGVKTTAEKGVADAATAQAAAETAQASADEAAGAVEVLEAYVGMIPEGYDETNIVAYINKKAEETLSSASGGSTESAASVLQALNTYKAENDPRVAANATAAANAQAAANTVDARVDVLVGDDADKSVRTIANEELAKQLIAEGAQESLDTLAEIAAWIQSHPDDASAMNKAIIDLEALVGTLPEGVTATTIVGYIQEAVAAEKTRAEGVETGLDARLAAVEAELAGEGEGTVAEQIAAAVADEAELRVAADDAIKGRLDALELIDHSHANQAELDLIATGDKAKWDAAAAQAHTHENAAELAKVVDGSVAKWDAALQAADIVTGTANGTIAVKGTDVAVKGLGSAAYTEAAAYDAAGAADTALTSAKAYTDVEVQALADSLKAITTTEINSLFTETA